MKNRNQFSVLLKRFAWVVGMLGCFSSAWAQTVKQNKPVKEEEGGFTKTTYVDTVFNDKTGAFTVEKKIVWKEGTITRRKLDSTINEDGSIEVNEEAFNCKGNKRSFTKYEKLDANRKLISSTQTSWDEKGNITGGYKMHIDPGMVDQTWEKWVNGGWQPAGTVKVPLNEDKKKEAPEKPSDLPTPGLTFCPRPSNFFVGISTVFEDGYKRFNTYGGNVAYTYPASSTIGITADGGIYFGSSLGIDYTKYQLLVGASLISQSGPKKVSLSPHLLAGIALVHSKYNGSFSNSSSSFSLAAGTDVIFPLNDKLNIALRADYNPSFASGGVSNNFRLSAGVALPL